MNAATVLVGLNIRRSLQRLRRPQDFAKDDGLANCRGIAQPQQESACRVSFANCRYRSGDRRGGFPCRRGGCNCRNGGRRRRGMERCRCRRGCRSALRGRLGARRAGGRRGGRGDAAEAARRESRDPRSCRLDGLQRRWIRARPRPHRRRNRCIDRQADRFHETPLALRVRFLRPRAWTHRAGRRGHPARSPPRAGDRSRDRDDQDNDWK
jgi:hypothetical protein